MFWAIGAKWVSLPNPKVVTVLKPLLVFISVFHVGRKFPTGLECPESSATCPRPTSSSGSSLSPTASSWTHSERRSKRLVVMCHCPHDLNQTNLVPSVVIFWLPRLTSIPIPALINNFVSAKNVSILKWQELKVRIVLNNTVVEFASSWSIVNKAYKHPFCVS